MTIRQFLSTDRAVTTALDQRVSMMQPRRTDIWRHAILLGLITAAATSCGGGGEPPVGQTAGQTTQGPDGPAGEDATISLVATEEVSPGDECELGGVQVSTGVDADRDGVLSAEEAATGSTTVLCRAPSMECPQAPVNIIGLDGTDQQFVEGLESDPLTIQLDASGDATAEIELRVIATDMVTTMGANRGEFTLTPTTSGGPWRIGVVAFDGCTVDTEAFVLDEVLPNLAYLRAFNTVSPSDVEISGPAGTLFSLATWDNIGPVEIDAGSTALDFSSDLPNIMAQGDDNLDAAIDGTYDIITYADVDANAYGLKWLFLESDWTPSATAAKLRVINLNRTVAQADIRVLGDTPTTFDDLSFGQPAAAADTSPGFAVGVDLDGDGTDDRNFVFSERLTAAGTVANVILVDNVDTSATPTNGVAALVAQYIDEDGGSEVGEEAGALPLDFEEGVMPPFASLEGDADWFVATDQTSSGTYSLRSGTVVNDRVSRLRLKVVIPTDGTLSFDWKAKGRRLENLYFCLPNVTPCDRYSNTALMTIDINGEDRAWETVDVPLTAGVYELRWEFRVGDFRLGSEDIGGWIDNLTFVPAP